MRKMGAETPSAKQSPKENPKNGLYIMPHVLAAGFSKLRQQLKKVTRLQLLCLVAAAALSGASYLLSGQQSILTDGNVIRRSAPGSTDRQYELYVNGIGSRPESLQLRVSARELTEAEAETEIDALIEELAVHILGQNDSLSHVTGNLKLKKTVSGHESVRLSWYPEHPGLVSYEGEVSNLGLTEPQQTMLRVVLRAGTCRREYALPVTVYPAEATTPKDLLKKLDSSIRLSDEEQRNENALRLPMEVGGTPVSYALPPDRTWIRLLAMGILAFALLGMKPEQDRRQRQKQRETELLADYSDIISKLVIYMGAGLTAGNAWVKIAENYEESLQKGAVTRIAYEELCRTAGELKKGVSESRAFADFASRCQLGCYLKLVSLLEQNRKTGDPRSENALLLEAQESFEQRKNTARRLGEEAGTKLMLPLILSLITVMMIVAVPAMLTLA